MINGLPSWTIARLLHNCVIKGLEIDSSSIVILTYYVVKSSDKGIIKQKKTETIVCWFLVTCHDDLMHCYTCVTFSKRT